MSSSPVYSPVSNPDYAIGSRGTTPSPREDHEDSLVHQDEKVFAQESPGVVREADRIEPKSTESESLSGPGPVTYPRTVSHKANRIHSWLYSHRYFNMWWWEVACCVVALTALLAMIATIRSYDGKPLPQWKYGITMNALIAVYTLILKAAAGLILAEGISHLKWIALAQPQALSTFVAHDNASRGPMGALTLLLRNNYGTGKSRILLVVSSLGAIVTLLVLLLEPFSQQIIRTYQCAELVHGEFRSVARTNVYQEPDSINTASGHLTQDIPASIRGAVYNGIFASQKPEMPFTCRTGNCTFTNEFSTVAYCNDCSDVTHTLLFTSDNGGTNATLPTAWALGDAWENTTLIRGNGGWGQAFVSSLNYVGSWAMIRWNGPQTADDDTPDTFNAYICYLYPCIKTVETSISGNQIQEKVLEKNSRFGTVLNSSDLLSAGIYSTVDLDCLDNPDQKEKLKRLGYEWVDSARWLPYNVSLGSGTIGQPVYNWPNKTEMEGEDEVGEDDACMRSLAHQYLDLCKDGDMTSKAVEVVPARCIYNIGADLDGRLNYVWEEMFSGSVSLGGWNNSEFNATDALAAIYYPGSGKGTFQDVQGVMDYLTETLTIQIRQRGQAGYSEPATGDMYDSVTCIQVRWEWLSYAAAVVTLLLIFFVWLVIYARIVQSRLRKQWETSGSRSLLPIHDFKGSALSLLFHGLHDQSLTRLEGEGVGASNREKELSDKAGELTVRFVATNQGWKLAAVDS